jgi:hypothetical protein
MSVLAQICRALLVAGATAEMIVAAVEAEQVVNEKKHNERRARDAERKRKSRAASAVSPGRAVTARTSGAPAESEQAIATKKDTQRRRSRAASSMSRGQPVTPSPTLSPSTPPSITTPPVGGDGGVRARDGVISTQAIELADEVMAILGVDRESVPPAWCGAAMWLSAGIATGWRPELVRLAAQRVAAARRREGPPGSYRYLEKPILHEHQEAARPVPPAPPDLPLMSTVEKDNEQHRKDHSRRPSKGVGFAAYALRLATSNDAG